VTGRLGGRVRRNSILQAGAADYVVKDHLHRLSPAVLRALNVRQSRDAQARAYQLQAATYRHRPGGDERAGTRRTAPHHPPIVGELMPAKNIYIALYDEANGTAHLSILRRRGRPAPGTRRLGRGITEYVLRTGDPCSSNRNPKQNLDYLGAVESIGTASVDWLGCRSSKPIGPSAGGEEAAQPAAWASRWASAP